METNEKSRVLDMTRGNPFRLVLKFLEICYSSFIIWRILQLPDMFWEITHSHRLEQFRRYMDLSQILHLE
jgi:hypothetical protein